jgi:hypothetical protein
MIELNKQLQKEREERRKDLDDVRQKLDAVLGIQRKQNLKLDTILDKFGVSQDESEEDAVTRVKQIWKKETDKKRPHSADQKSLPIMKSLFGICGIASADFETGDLGSKAIHPSSMFSKGALLAPPAPKRSAPTLLAPRSRSAPSP